MFSNKISFFFLCKWRIGHNLRVSVYERETIPYSLRSKDERNFITINKNIHIIISCLIQNFISKRLTIVQPEGKGGKTQSNYTLR